MKQLSLATLFLAALPTFASVVIVSPASNSTVTSPVSLVAKISGTLPTSITVYTDGTQTLSERGTANVTQSITLATGIHSIQVNANYQSRQKTSTVSASVTFTVGSSTTPPPNPGEAAQIYGDMTGSNEANPQGWPVSWGEGPSIGLGNIPPSNWTAATAWGVVYQAWQGNTATNTRVNLANVQLWFLSKSKGTWALVQNTSQPDGAAYKEDFSGDISIPADVRTEPDGTISVTSGMGSYAGDNFHFYPSNRGQINPNDVGGVVAIFEARLIVGNTTLPDDRATAAYVAEVGADYWPCITCALPRSYNNVTPPVGGGRFKYVTDNWRSFAMTTMTLAQLTANSPPVNLSNILP
jgi:hypothetical protein